MSRIIGILILLVVLWNYSYSQITYPKSLINGTDTIIGITNSQVKVLNQVFENLRYQKQLNDSLVPAINECQELINSTNEEVKIVTKQRDNVIIINSNQKILISQLDKDIKKANRSNSWLKLSSKGEIIIAVIGGYLLGKNIKITL
jgi:hypothetical protein